MRIEFTTHKGEILILESDNPTNLKLTIQKGEGMLTGWTTANLSDEDIRKLDKGLGMFF